MIFSDNILEKGHIFLRNLIVNSQNTQKDVWSSPSSGYGIYPCPYEVPLGLDKNYYVRFTYKFTTTNQSPTWVQYYIQGGTAAISGGRINNPVAGTEYTVSGIGGIHNVAVTTITTGTIYNGNSNAINGVSSQIKNIVFYDVDELYLILKQAGLVSTTTELKTWCDNNLDYSPAYTNYDITDLLSEAIEKIAITKGNIIADNFIEGEGLDFYATSDTIRLHKYFDTGSALGIYNNKGGGTVVHTRVDAKEQDSPFYPKHPYILKITTNGTASPGAGGFVCSHPAAANRIVIERFIAKIPIGYTITAAFNNQGTGASVTYLSPRAGTGEWQEYAILYKCGATSGSTNFSTGGHVYISGSDNTNVTWYVAYCISCIITDAEYLKNFSILGNTERIKEGSIFSRQFDNLNLLPYGNGEKQLTSLFSNTNWTYDIDDVVGNAKASIVQPINAGAMTFEDFIKIEPGQRYKVSYWVKCKGDMSSFLTAVYYYTASKDKLLTHVLVHFTPGTRTQLTQELKSGDTTVKVKSNANWISRSYAKLGFRSGAYTSYNNIGISNGNGSGSLVKDTTGTDTINLNLAYMGATMPVNTYVVETYDGSNYPYPILKSQLPTDNEWKYVEGYFGDNYLWDGAATSTWASIPMDARYMKLCLNIYKNNGTVPIKYCDIRIEPVKAGSLDRYENKIQIIGGN